MYTYNSKNTNQKANTQSLVHTTISLNPKTKVTITTH